MFTKWMKINEKYEEVRQLTYTDFPRDWVWHSDSKKWTKRKVGNCIGRLFYTHPSSREKL